MVVTRAHSLAQEEIMLVKEESLMKAEMEVAMMVSLV